MVPNTSTRLSNRITRENEDSRVKEPNAARWLELDLEVPCHPDDVDEVDRTLPRTWCAMFTPSTVFAYVISGSFRLSEPRG